MVSENTWTFSYFSYLLVQILLLSSASLTSSLPWRKKPQSILLCKKTRKLTLDFWLQICLLSITQTAFYLCRADHYLPKEKLLKIKLQQNITIFSLSWPRAFATFLAINDDTTQQWLTGLLRYLWWDCIFLSCNGNIPCRGRKLPTGAPLGAGNLLPCFLIITSLIGCLEWWYKNAMGCRRQSGPRMEVVAPAMGTAQPDFPSPLSHWQLTRESFCGPATFSLLSCSCFIHALHGTGFVSSTAWCYLPCPRSHCERFGSPETAGIAEKKVTFVPGAQGSAQEPGLSLLSVGFEEDFLKQADASGDWLHVGIWGEGGEFTWR